MNLKQKATISLSSIVIIIMLMTTIIVSVLTTHQNKLISHDVIIKSFNLIEEIISETKTSLSLDTVQLAKAENMGDKIRFLSENRSVLGYLTVSEMYEKVTKLILNTGIVADLWKTAIYDNNGDLISFALFDDDKTQLGFIHMLPTVNCKTYDLQKGQDIHFSNIPPRITNNPPDDFDLTYKQDRFKQITLRFEVIDNFLCLVAYMPISADTYDAKTDSISPRTWGFVKAVKKLDTKFISRTTRLTGMMINIFTKNTLSAGSMKGYKKLSMSKNDILGLTHGNQPIYLSDILLEEQAYFQGVLQVETQTNQFASIAVLLSKKMAKQNTSQMVKILFFVTLAVIIVIPPVALFLITRLLINPVIKLTQITSKIAWGDLDRRIDTTGSDELGTLAKSFAQMQDSIKERIFALETAEEKYRNLFEFAPDAICITSLEGDLLSFNDAFFKMTRIDSKKDLFNVNATSFYKNPDKKRPEMLYRIIKNKVIENFELEFKTITGEIRPSYLSLRLIQYENNPAILTLIRDMTDHKKAQTELSSLRNLLINIINSMPSVLIGVDQDCRVTQWNAEAEKTTGVRAGKAAGQPLETVCPLILGMMDRVEQAVKTHLPFKSSKIPHEINNEIRFLNTTIYPLEGENQNGAVIRIDDITEQVRLEEVMIQSEKMLSLGGLAAGMAHEINNPLAGILQNTIVLKNRLTKDITPNHRAADASGISMEKIKLYIEKRELVSIMDNLSQAGKRAAEIVRNMLSFARKTDSNFVNCRLDELLDNTIELAKTDYNLKKQYDFKLIQIEKNYQDNLSYVMCEKSKIQQVFLNILQNGAHAMAEGGTFDGKPPRFIVSTKNRPKQVEVSIRNNGPAMDEATRKRVFEPFFTTKPVGKGTGLGLSVSYFIITENHEGRLSVTSSPNSGVEFMIKLPVKSSGIRT